MACWPTDEKFHRRLRAEAAAELEQVKTLARIVPPLLLEELDQRAARLERAIEQYDQYLNRPASL